MDQEFTQDCSMLLFGPELCGLQYPHFKDLHEFIFTRCHTKPAKLLFLRQEIRSKYSMRSDNSCNIFKKKKKDKILPRSMGLHLISRADPRGRLTVSTAVQEMLIQDNCVF